MYYYKDRFTSKILIENIDTLISIVNDRIKMLRDKSLVNIEVDIKIGKYEDIDE